MPVCNIVISENVKVNKEQSVEIRKIVAAGLNSKSRKLDEDHIAMRIQYGTRQLMLADVEINIFSQLYLRRLFSRDKRANNISLNVSELLDCNCATWINMCMVGYARVDNGGNVFFSDSDNELIRKFQELRGIATRTKK